jgi:hypothetical protein
LSNIWNTFRSSDESMSLLLLAGSVALAPCMPPVLFDTITGKWQAQIIGWWSMLCSLFTAWRRKYCVAWRLLWC